MQYELKGGAFPVVECRLQSGEQMITERGSMVWMSPNMSMETKGGGLGKMFSKALTGESMFQNIYTAKGDGLIAFGCSFPGRILPVEVWCLFYAKTNTSFPDLSHLQTVIKILPSVSFFSV